MGNTFKEFRDSTERDIEKITSIISNIFAFCFALLFLIPAWFFAPQFFEVEVWFMRVVCSAISMSIGAYTGNYIGERIGLKVGYLLVWKNIKNMRNEIHIKLERVFGGAKDKVEYSDIKDIEHIKNMCLEKLNLITKGSKLEKIFDNFQATDTLINEFKSFIPENGSYKLSVIKDSDLKYCVEFEGVENEVKILHATLKDINKRIERLRTIRDKGDGEFVLRQILSRPVFNGLQNAPSGDLKIETNIAGMPWKNMYDGRNFLGERFNIKIEKIKDGDGS